MNIFKKKTILDDFNKHLKLLTNLFSYNWLKTTFDPTLYGNRNGTIIKNANFKIFVSSDNQLGRVELH